MSADGDGPVNHEVVIVRRRGGGEDEGHHGGAWKIAFADLMTAMMTFFLVMWLLNISDKEKITKIATYFNPTLSDRRANPKGIHDPKEAEEAPGAEEKAPTPQDPKSKDDHKAKREETKGQGEEKKGSPEKSEDELFNDPYGVLAKMALRAMEGGDRASGGNKPADQLLPGGEAYRNPFEPYAANTPLLEQPPAESANPDRNAAAGAGAKVTAEPGEDVEKAASSPEAAARAKAGLAEAQGLANEIVKSLEGLTSANTPNIEVQRVDDGLLVSLTDDFKFGMFGVSSAAPVPQVVVVMERIAKVLADRPGQIVLRGHTDGRPFKSGRNDNWRLSMDRARVAFYMLTRGGLQENRIDRVEGHADHDLKVPGDPNAAQNRRIEILLKVPKT
jgi:chemotaxis protein MotB